MQKNVITQKIKGLTNYLLTVESHPSIKYTQQEVEEIIKTEEMQTKANYLQKLKEFYLSNKNGDKIDDKYFVVFWGLPGAGKSFLAQKIIQNYKNSNKDIEFDVIDKDAHRRIFANLATHLKGHSDECEKFGGIAIKYVRKILDIALENKSKSILSVGAMGAGAEFCENATKAIDKGYKAEAIYMAVNPDIAYLSNVYRCCSLYDKMINEGQELYPRLVDRQYFDSVILKRDSMIEIISDFQAKNPEKIDFKVVNRDNKILYDSDKDKEVNILSCIKKEENRPFNSDELILINKQITLIEHNIRFRCDNDTYKPSSEEVNCIQNAITKIKKQIEKQENFVSVMSQVTAKVI